MAQQIGGGEQCSIFPLKDLRVKGCQTSAKSWCKAHNRHSLCLEKLIQKSHLEIAEPLLGSLRKFEKSEIAESWL